MSDSNAIPEGPWDLVVIGGGAAGFFGALTAAESSSRKQRILILEKSSQLLGKVRISGGGRCNVTHACFDPRDFAAHYPRGEKALIGPLTRWSATDTITWFEKRGVQLKTEEDGRMFPVTDNSQTIIDCLVKEAQRLGIQIRTQTAVTSISPIEEGQPGYQIGTTEGGMLETRNILMATGGTRSADTAGLIRNLGHTLEPAVPSLFTFKIPGDFFKDLAGVSVSQVRLSIPPLKLGSAGPMLITHWGLSGPSILRLSAWGARALHAVDYRFTLLVNWLPGSNVESTFPECRTMNGKRAVASRSPFPEIPRRLWERLVERSEIATSTTWSRLSKPQTKKLASLLTETQLEVDGKSLNKEEFVTCGGVLLKEVDLRTMESRRLPGIFFAGEVLNIDGITGGFNFQNAWTTGHLAGKALFAG